MFHHASQQCCKWNLDAVFHRTRLESRLLGSSTRNMARGITVTRNRLARDSNDGITKGPKCELEPSGYAPSDLEFSEFFGSGSEFLPFWRPTLSLIRLFEEEDD